MHVWLLLSSVVLSICYVNGLKTADYESSWLPLISGVSGDCVITVSHQLGEVPLIVDVQVKSIQSPNDGYIFQAVGGRPRDDDGAEHYGGVVYVYNDIEVIVSAPCPSNDLPTGKSLYLANDNYYAGPNTQLSDEVLVRIRAWKSSSLPRPTFQKTNMYAQTGSSDVYFEEEHGLGTYPALILVRAKLIINDNMNGTMSDAVGASIVSYHTPAWTTNGYVIHGYNDKDVRVWISTRTEDGLFTGDDGFSIGSANSKQGYIEIYVWSDKALQPSKIITTELGPNVANEEFELSLPRLKEDDFVRAWVESKSGLNTGYRFSGSGALAYTETQTNPVCSYGGLVYGYGDKKIRFWRPSNTLMNAGIVCIADLFGDGSTSERQVEAKVVVKVWDILQEHTIIHDNILPVANQCVSKSNINNT